MSCCCNNTLNAADEARAEITEAPPVAYGFVVVNTTTRTVHDAYIYPDRDVPNRIAANREGLACAAIAWKAHPHE